MITDDNPITQAEQRLRKMLEASSQEK
jgi:hypothetical protein